MAAKAAVRPRPLKVEAIKISADMVQFGGALRNLKLDVLGTDDSPIPITGQPASSPPSLPSPEFRAGVVYRVCASDPR
jgi:hypothetical protein